MQIHELARNSKLKRAKRVARGGKRGTYAGRGAKGQKSRSGSGGKNIVEKGRSSWIKRFPKLGGFNSTYLPNIVVKTSELEKYFAAGEIVNPETLAKFGLAKNLKRGKSGKAQIVKILFDTPIKKKMTLEQCKESKQARSAIEKAGGAVQREKKKKKKRQVKKPVK